MAPGIVSGLTEEQTTVGRLDKRSLSARLRTVRAHILKHGALLQADSELDSIVTLVVGEPVAGSWWSHERAHDIYDVCVALEADTDIFEMKLIKGKVTHVHRQLWPAIYALAAHREGWQRRGLSPMEVSLLEDIERYGSVRTDEYRALLDNPRVLPNLVRKLERRWLIVSEEFHTPSGAHAKRLMNWPAWAAARGFRDPGLAPESARQQLLATVRSLGGADPERYLPLPRTT